MPTTDYLKSALGTLGKVTQAVITKAPPVAANYLASTLGIKSRLQYDITVERYHSPRACAQVLNAYAPSIKTTGLIKPVADLIHISQTQVNNVLGDPKTGLETFKDGINNSKTLAKSEIDTKISIIETIEKKLKNNLVPSADVQAFQQKLQVLHDLLQNNQVNNPRAIAAYIDGEYQTLIAQLEADRDRALKAIKNIVSTDAVSMSPEERGAMKDALEKRINDAYNGAKNAIETMYAKSYDLISLSADPATIDKKALAALTENKSCYLLFNSKVYFVDDKLNLTELEQQTKDSNLASLFPAEKDKKTPATKAQLDAIASSTGHVQGSGIREQITKATEQAETELLNLEFFDKNTPSKSVEDLRSGLSMGAGHAPPTDDPKKYREISFDDYAKFQPARSQDMFSFAAWCQYVEFLRNPNGGLRTPDGGMILNIEDDCIAVTVPSKSAAYHYYLDNLLASDFLRVAKLARAKGDKVIIEINIHDPELRQRVMEEAYIAATLAGFSKENIKFNVGNFEEKEQNINGETAEALLKSGRLGEAHQKYEHRKVRWDAEKAEVLKENEGKFNADVSNIGAKVDKIIEDNKIKADTGPSDPDADTEFSVKL